MESLLRYWHNRRCCRALNKREKDDGEWMDFRKGKGNGTPDLSQSDESNASAQENSLSVTWADLVNKRSGGKDDVRAKSRARGTVVSPGMLKVSTDNFDDSDEDDDEEADSPTKSRARGTVVSPGMLKVSTDDFDDSEEDDEEVLGLCNMRGF